MTIDNKLQQIIIDQAQIIPYHSHNATSIIKQCAHQAFFNLLLRQPQILLQYLTEQTKHHYGLQHQLFQEFVLLLENKLPFQIIKNRKNYTINNLLDPNLFIFDGVSHFDSIINENHIIKNNTQEFYVGGRLGSIAKPYYLGKLLQITDPNNISLLSQVSWYSFSQIFLPTVKPGTCVKVCHLRIPPHYQMGGMLYINRARQQIIQQWKKMNANS